MFTLALAIGATTAIFTVVYGVLLRPLPYPSPDRIMAVWEVNHRGRYSALSDPNFNDFRDRNRSFVAMAKFRGGIRSVTAMGEPTRTVMAMVSRDFFKVLGTEPSIGRSFSIDETRIGGAPVVVVSHGYWMRSLGSSPDLSNLHLRIEGRDYSVVGVMPSGFQFPAKVDLWTPIEVTPDRTSRTAHNSQAIGRLRDGVTLAQATGDISAIARDIIRHSSEQGDYLLADATAVPLQSSLTRRVGSTLYVLLGAVCFLLLIACANVTNLLLAQASARQRELAIRHALGAGHLRLIRQFVTETVVLVTMSCLGGLLIARLGTSALLALAPPDLPRLEDVSMNWAVLAFAMALSAIVAFALGLLTATRAARRDARDTLVDGSRGQAGSASSQRVGRAIVAMQMALTVVLLVGAALLGRSLQQALAIDPGFRTDGIIAMDLAMSSAGDAPEKARLSSFYADVFDRLRTIAGVDDVAAANAVPLDGGLADGMFAVISTKDQPRTMDDIKALFQQKERLGTADFCVVSPAYFRALGIPLVRGRLFDDRDAPNAPHVALISESLARTRWPDTDPIGATVEFGNMDGDLRPLTIIGVVGDTRELGVEQAPRPTLYVNLIQRPPDAATVVMRASADTRAVTSAARDILRDAAPDVPPRFRTFEQIYSASLGARRFNLTLVAVFAATALVLAIVGIYGVMTYNVTQRRREIGVRVALGAQRGQVLRGILGEGMATTGIGIALGLAAALALTRTMQSLLFGVTPTDPLTFVFVILVLASVAAAASYVPARRATDVDPIDALREE